MMTTTELYLTVAVDRIAPSGHNPRRTFDEDGLAELADSLKTVGMIEPLIVRPGAEDGAYLLVAGERRLRAAKLAGLDEVPCVLRDYDDRGAREVQLVENLQRKNVTGIEEAQGFRELMDDYGYSAEQLAERVGKKARVIYQRLALLKLPESVKDAMAAGTLTTNHAILIARAPAARQIELMEETQRDGMSVRDLDHHIKRTITLKLDAAPFDRADAELLPAAGSCEACPKRSGNAREMFPEITSPDVCTDKDCYDEKIVQHVNREIARNPDLVRIKSYQYWPGQPKHVLGPNQYTLLAKKKDRCESAARAILVFGENVGTLVDVCINPVCKQHKRGSSGYESSADDKAKARAEKLKIELARVLRNRVVDAILDIPVTLPNLLETVTENWWEHLGSDYRRLIRKRHPEWDADILPIGDLPEEKMERLLIEFSLVRDLMVFSYGVDKGIGDGLKERAEAAGVDWKAIEAQVKAELNAPKPKKPAKKQRTGICVHDGCINSIYDGGRFCEEHVNDGPGHPERDETPQPKRGKKNAAPVDTSAGVESDNGVEIQLRAKAKGPVLAEILLLRAPLSKGKGRKAMTEPGWAADITIALKGEPKQAERVYDDAVQQTPFVSSAPALFAAYTRIGDLAVGIGGQALMVREWTARKLAALAA